MTEQPKKRRRFRITKVDEERKTVTMVDVDDNDATEVVYHVTTGGDGRPCFTHVPDIVGGWDVSGADAVETLRTWRQRFGVSQDKDGHDG